MMGEGIEIKEESRARLARFRCRPWFYSLAPILRRVALKINTLWAECGFYHSLAVDLDEKIEWLGGSWQL